MIVDYTELIAEVTRQTEYDDFPSYADLLTGVAEAYLNDRLLLGPMETKATLTLDANSEADLPADYKQMRVVYSGTSIAQEFPLEDVIKQSVSGYAISGGKIIATTGMSEYDIIYYAKLPSLIDNQTNWLLSLDSSIYQLSLMEQAFRWKSNIDAAGVTNQLLNTGIDRLNSADVTARFSGTRFTTQGPTP